MQFRPARPTVTFRIAIFRNKSVEVGFHLNLLDRRLSGALKFKLKLDCDVTRDCLITWSSQSSFPLLLAKNDNVLMYSKRA